MRGDRISFSHLLPVLALALLVVLVFVPITLTSLHLYEASRGATQIHIQSGQFDMMLPRDQIVPWAIRMVTVSKAQLMMAINLPGLLFQALVSLSFRTATWHPQALLLDTWRTLVFPFFALPFWWLVGCGLDGIVSKERLHWPVLLAGTLLSAACLLLALGGVWAPEQFQLVWVIRGFAGWTIAFGILPMAWIAQSIRQRREPQPQAA